MPTFDFQPGNESYNAVPILKYGVIYNPGDGFDNLAVQFPGVRLDNFVIDLRGFPHLQSVDDVIAVSTDIPHQININFSATDRLSFTQTSAVIPASKEFLRNVDFVFGKIHDTGDATGMLTTQSATRPDGTSVVTQRDGGDAFVWATVADEYNAAGQRTEQRIFDDDFETHREFFDPAGSFNWSSLTTDYNEQGQLTTQRVRFDDNSLQVTYWDPYNLYDWSQVNELYDTQSRRTTQQVYDDAGTRQAQYFDADSAQNWQYVVDYFNTSGFRYQQAILYDDGTSATIVF
jgi:hypothetical protein